MKIVFSLLMFVSVMLSQGFTLKVMLLVDS